jgi:hypothetical protein
MERDAAPGIHRVEDAHTNWWNWCLVEDDGAITIVDAGVPSSWVSFESALRGLARSRGT